MKGRPYIARLLTGQRKPKITRLGVDVAGQVEAVGKNVTQFKPGDEVFGSCIRGPQASGVRVWDCQGAFAEYVCAPESTLVMKPDGVTFEQAASAPVPAFTALQGLRDKGHIQPGQKVLINGAAGGVGTFAVQIAKSFGAQGLLAYAARGMWTWCDHSAQIRSLTIPKKISPRVGNVMTSCSIALETIRCQPPCAS
jgi:NADPH:quinone reductase-like Zn-dependent oxidoreductase